MILLLKLVRIRERRGQFGKETSKTQAEQMLKRKLRDLQSAVFVLWTYRSVTEKIGYER